MALIRSHATQDDEHFYAIALQVAANAARKGQAKFAHELRAHVDEAQKRKYAPRGLSGSRPLVFAQPKGELAGLVTVSYPQSRLGHLVLNDSLMSGLEQVMVEQRQRDELHRHAYEPMRKLLLAGPPGTGKTMTASAIASELNLPLFSVQLHGVITKFLGETAAKMHAIFKSMNDTRGVFFFDEFDAFGSDRGASNDVGEIRRVLNSFLQLLDADQSDSVIVCATNYSELLDQALFRRFDKVFEYLLPKREHAVKIMQSLLATFSTAEVDWNSLAEDAIQLSQAEITKACIQAAKNAILSQSKELTTTDVSQCLKSFSYTQSTTQAE